jgi:arsenite methyltransferase
LGPRLRRAGFAVEHVETLTILNPRLHEDTYSHGIIGLIRSFVARRDMQAAEAEAWELELRELGARDEYFFSLGRFVFLARRPSHKVG